MLGDVSGVFLVELTTSARAPAPPLAQLGSVSTLGLYFGPVALCQYSGSVALCQHFGPVALCQYFGFVALCKVLWFSCTLSRISRDGLVAG